MGLFDKFTRKTSKIVNANALGAIAASGLLGGAASGKIDEDEVKKLKGMLNANPRLSGFKSGEIDKKISSLAASLKEDFDFGKKLMLDEIRKVSDDDDVAQECLWTLLAVAKTGDGLDETEKAVAVEVASELGLELKKFGLA